MNQVNNHDYPSNHITLDNFESPPKTMLGIWPFISWSVRPTYHLTQPLLHFDNFFLKSFGKSYIYTQLHNINIKTPLLYNFNKITDKIKLNIISDSYYLHSSYNPIEILEIKFTKKYIYIFTFYQKQHTNII